MINTPSQTEQREHLYRLLKQFHTAMLVTHDHAGEESLRARPMAIAQVDDHGEIWFVTSIDSAKTHEIDDDRRVHLVCQDDHSVYLSISGRARLEQDRAKLAEVWSEMMKVWFPAGKDDPSIVLIAVTPEIGEFWDNEGVHKFKYLFESAKAYITGKTPELEEGSEHGRTRL